MSVSSPLFNLLLERGFVYQTSNREALIKDSELNPLVAYVGFDCTAPSLHVGSLLQLMMLRHFQDAGHKPLIVLGSATTRIGDPSFRSDTRPILTDETIEHNKNGIYKTIQQFIRLDTKNVSKKNNDALVLDNKEWLNSLSYVDFLREVGSCFSVNRMLHFDSVATRLEREEPLSFLEFNYMILQAYDFWMLYRRFKCTLQLGGSDQWGNIVNGIDLIRRKESREVYGLTSPLLTTASGTKMGKTQKGAIWLDAQMCSPYNYWQFWRNCDDADVGRFLRLFTFLPLDEIQRLESLQGQGLNEAKKILATHATAIAHGQEASQEALAGARHVFEAGTLEGLDVQRLHLKHKEGVALLQALVDTSLCKSLGEARRLVRGGGVRINDDVVKDEMTYITKENERGNEKLVKLSVGRKKHIALKLRNS